MQIFWTDFFANKFLIDFLPSHVTVYIFQKLKYNEISRNVEKTF